MRKMLLATAGFVVSLGSFAGNLDRSQISELTTESRQLAGKILDQIRGELVAELERTGPLRAILVCKFSAPEITSRISRQQGLRVTRVSLRPRNPSLGEADAWEQQVLLDFEKKITKGAKPETLEHAEIIEEPAGHYFRYLRAIPTGPACLVCHGTNLSEGVKAQLRTDYPHDKGANLQPGDLRGAVSIKKEL